MLTLVKWLQVMQRSCGSSRRGHVGCGSGRGRAHGPGGRGPGRGGRGPGRGRACKLGHECWVGAQAFFIVGFRFINMMFAWLYIVDIRFLDNVV